ncbi:MAG: hypothetical protein HUK20_04705, partial [Fibrobacter sp.]|nr:hypothetical protein [Fibrobacter sp.]
MEKKKVMKEGMCTVLCFLVSLLFVQCGLFDSGTKAEQKTYSNDSLGWSVDYNTGTFEVTKDNALVTQFAYAKKKKNTVTISYFPNKKPLQVIEDVTKEWGDAEKIENMEGHIPGTNDRWGYWRILHTTKSDGTKV